MEGSNTQSQKRQRTEPKTRSAMLTDLDVLDCPICYEPLTIPTFQCNDGHLVCCSCLAKTSNKCPGPACDLPIGDKRCFPMEKVLEKVLVPCSNAEFGCPNSYYYGNLTAHEKECEYFKCSCPKLDCDFTGSSKSIYSHFLDTHLNDSKNVSSGLRSSLVGLNLNINDKNFVLWEHVSKQLFVVQCFKEQNGVYITVRHVPSSIPADKKFKYRLSYSIDGHKFTYESPEVKRFLEANSERPEESLMFVPNSLLWGDILKFQFAIMEI